MAAAAAAFMAAADMAEAEGTPGTPEMGLMTSWKDMAPPTVPMDTPPMVMPPRELPFFFLDLEESFRLRV